MAKPEAKSIDPDAKGSRAWTVGELARLAKCTLRSIRFYEQQGLLSVEERTGGRHRRYSSEQYERLQLIVALRNAGLCIDDIRSIIEVKRRHATGAAASVELRRLLVAQIYAIGERLKALQQLREELEQLNATLFACADCSDTGFPSVCVDCSKPATSAGTVQLLRTVWSHRP